MEQFEVSINRENILFILRKRFYYLVRLVVLDVERYLKKLYVMFDKIFHRSCAASILSRLYIYFHIIAMHTIAVVSRSNCHVLFGCESVPLSRFIAMNLSSSSNLPVVSNVLRIALSVYVV